MNIKTEVLHIAPSEELENFAAIYRSEPEAIVRHIEDCLSTETLFGSYFCTGHVGSQPAQILIDEGGEISMVNPELIKQMPISERPEIRPIDLGIEAFNSPLTVLGYVEIPVTVAGITVQHVVILIEEMEQKNIDMLMGNDFTGRHDFHMRAFKSEAYFKGITLPVYRTKRTSTRGRLVCIEETSISSGGQALVPAILDGNPLCGPLLCAEQIPTWPYSGNVFIQTGLVDVSEDQLYVKVINESPDHVRVYRGEILTTLKATTRVTTLPPDEADSTLQTRFLQTCIRKMDAQLSVRIAGSVPQNSSVKQALTPDSPSSKVIHTSTINSPVDLTPPGLDSIKPSEDKELTYEDVISLLPDYMQCMCQDIHESLTPLEAFQVVELLLEMETVFHHPDRPLSVTRLLEHNIDVQGSHPIKQAPRRLPYHKLEIVKEELEKMLESNTIRPSISPWASPIVLVTKKDGTTRFCIDYRKLNDVTRKDAFPLPRTDECLDVLSGAKYFCTLDLASGFWQVGMVEKDKAKTAFCTKFGLYEFNVMPFGLCNAPATFERLTEYILSGMQWHEALVYIDDVVVFGKTFAECLGRLREVFLRFREHKLTFKPKKCELFRKEVEFLGHVVSEEGIQCNPNKISSIQQWEAPTSVTEVRSFLGMAGYYRRFIEHFADLAKPLTSLTKMDQVFSWNKDCQNSFEIIKKALVNAPILAYPDMSKQFILDTDASGFAAGAVLSQIQDDGEERPVAYYSKMFHDAEVNYCTTQRELLAVILSVKAFRHYLLGKPFLIRTDHSSLTWLKNFKEATGKIARWILKLEEYDYTMVFRRGVDHGNADAMSRMRVGTQSREVGERLCQFLLCPDCTPKRTMKEANSMCHSVDQEKCIHDNISIKLVSLEATTEPRRSQRLRARRDRVSRKDPGKVIVSRTDHSTPSSPLVTSSLPEPLPDVQRSKDTGKTTSPPRRSPRIAEQQQQKQSTVPGPMVTVDVPQVPEATEESAVPVDTDEFSATPMHPVPLETAQAVSPVPLETVQTVSPVPSLILSDIMKPIPSLKSSPDTPQSPAFSFSDTEGSNEDGSEGGSDEIDTDDEIEEFQKSVRPSVEPNWFAGQTSGEAREAQLTDEGLEQFIGWKEKGKKPYIKDIKTLHPTVRALYPQWKYLKLVQGVLYRSSQDSVSKQWVSQLVVPESMRSEIFKQLHGSILGGHLGRTRTIEAVRRKFYWPRYHADLKLWVKRCQICAEGKGVRKQYPKAPLKQKGAVAPFDVIAIDILTLTKTKQSNKYLLMVVDSFTKWVEAYPLAEHSAPTVAKILASRWMCDFGIPRQLHSDRGAEFTSKLMDHLCAALQIHKTKTPAYRPQANGLCERMNRTVCGMLSSFQGYFKDEEWDTILPYLMSAYRRSVHESTGLTPNMMVFGRECALPIEMMVGSPPDTPKCPVEFVQQIKELMQKAHAFAREKLNISAAKQKRNYDRYAGPTRKYSPGDNVMYFYTPKNQKLSRPWEQHIVLRVLDEEPYAAIYEISKGKDCRPRPVHIDNLKTYEGTEFIQKWWSDPLPPVIQDPETVEQGVQVDLLGLGSVVYEVKT